MKGYTGIFKMRIIRALQYRAAAWAGILTQLFYGFFRLMILVAFYRSAVNPPPAPFEQMADYVWLGQAFLMMTSMHILDTKLLHDISDGHVAYELCRPYRIYPFWFMRIIGMRIANTMMRCVPILCLTVFLPEPYRLHPPADINAFLIFLLSMAIGAALAVALSMFVYLMTFVTLSAHGPQFVVAIIAEFMMGRVIPIPLMPDAVQRVMVFFPFRYIADVPFRIYSGNITGAEALFAISVQLSWLIFSLALGSLGFKKVQRRILVQGG